MNLKLNNRIFLKLEFFIIYIFSPTLLTVLNVQLKNLVIPIIITFAIYSFIILILDKKFDREILYKINCKENCLIKVLLRFFTGSILLVILTLIFNKELFLYFPKSNFELWLTVLLFYPLISVYPQELVFRSFFFHRYSSIFKSDKLMVFMSGISFGFAHIIFQNWVAPLLSVLGGIIFANTYLKTNRLLYSVFEHSLWGDFIFTIGLGYYFYSGNI